MAAPEYELEDGLDNLDFGDDPMLAADGAPEQPVHGGELPPAPARQPAPAPAPAQQPRQPPVPAAAAPAVQPDQLEPDLAYYWRSSQRLKGTITRVTPHPSGNGGYGIIAWRCEHNNWGRPVPMSTWFDWDQCIGGDGDILEGPPQLRQRVEFTLASRGEDGHQAMDVTGRDGQPLLAATAQPAPKRRRY